MMRAAVASNLVSCSTMITTLPERIAALPADLRRACEQIFDVAVMAGYTDPPATMHAWIEQHFGAVAAVRQQTIVRVVNRLTLEAALFNPLRARRPLESGGGDAALEARIAAALAGGDIFRDPLRDTTADLFGRIRGQFCVTASNVAKYDGWHGLVIFDEPHPLRFDAARLRDYLDTALRWIAAAHAQDAQAIYPLIFWNCLPKSGATQMHGHMQLALTRGMHYARVELWRRAMRAYRAEHGAHYFDDLLAIHQALGLAISRDASTRAFAHLTPLRNREIILLAADRRPTTDDRRPTNNSPQPATDNGQRTMADLADTLYAILRHLIDVQGMRAFNLAITPPPLGPGSEDWEGFPILARLGDRGDPLATSSDLGATELYVTGCVTVDPFEVAAQLRTAIGQNQ
jgi:hypothetical protein